MSLRLRLILGYSALLLLLALAAWLGVRALTRDLTGALGETAASVGRSVFTVLQGDAGSMRIHRDGAENPAPEVRPGSTGRHVVMMRERIVAPGAPPRDDVRVIVDGRELAAEELAAHRARHPTPAIELIRREGDEAPMLRVSSEGIERAIPLPRAGVDAALARFTQRLGWGLLALLVAGLLLAVWIAQRVTQAASVRADRELAELGEIGRGLAHSLRNPLHALGLSLEALAAESTASASAAALAQSGREQLQRVDQALRGFLALSAGNGAEAVDVRIADVVDDVLLEASQRAQGRVRFERGGGDPRLRAVPAELRVMLHALTINALEASPEGGRVHVELTVLDAGSVRIDVFDEGAGVPAELRGRLFQPHVSGKPHGAGMGLYLAQRLARSRYRGHIALEPRTPHGTRARLVLQARESARG
jgi:signal transduction histidine kinase